MALSARVTNANGRIIGETPKGDWRYHQHDALGSTIALIDDAGTVTDTFQYWPYGEIQTPRPEHSYAVPVLWSVGFTTPTLAARPVAFTSGRGRIDRCSRGG